MPRQKKTISIDDKIEKQKHVVSQAKEQYETALPILNELMRKRNEIRSKQILDAIGSSKHTYEEILNFIKEESDNG